jgi:hypothetical protein
MPDVCSMSCFSVLQDITEHASPEAQSIDGTVEYTEIAVGFVTGHVNQQEVLWTAAVHALVQDLVAHFLGQQIAYICPLLSTDWTRIGAQLQITGAADVVSRHALHDRRLHDVATDTTLQHLDEAGGQFGRTKCFSHSVWIC